MVATRGRERPFASTPLSRTPLVYFAYLPFEEPSVEVEGLLIEMGQWFTRLSVIFRQVLDLLHLASAITRERDPYFSGGLSSNVDKKYIHP
jgi:hypothetical protein